MKMKKQTSGFTLIEVLLAVSMTVILGGGVLALIYITGQNRLVTFQNLLNVDQTNYAVATMERELRNLRPGDNAAYPLITANDQEMVFYSDIDYDSETEKVRYTLNGTQLIKGVIKPVGFPATYPPGTEKVKTITSDVRNGATPIFYYYNGDWPADTTDNPLPAPVRLSDSKILKIHLELNTKNDPKTDFVLETYVQLRMLKQNL